MNPTPQLLEEEIAALEGDENSASQAREYERALEIKGQLDEKRAKLLPAKGIVEAVSKSRDLLSRFEI